MPKPLVIKKFVKLTPAVIKNAKKCQPCPPAIKKPYIKVINNK